MGTSEASVARLRVGGYRNPVYGLVASTKFTKAWFKEERLPRVRELAERFAAKHGYTITELTDEPGFRITLKTDAKRWKEEQERMLQNLMELEEWLDREQLFGEKWGRASVQQTPR